MSSAFLMKFRVVYYRAEALLRRWSTMNFFLKKKTFFIFFKQLVFGTFSKKNLWWILFIAKLQSENCRLITLMKETPWEFSKLLQSIIFLNISICGEVNYMKDYMKATKKGWFLRFLHWVLLNTKHLLERNCRNRTAHLSILDLKRMLSMKYLTNI